MKVTIYTINDCKFSQAEKEYLNKNNIAFEEKNLETNRNYLTEMLSVSDNFAGTPVTKVEKDGGETMVLKGFTQDEFAKALDLAPGVGSTTDAGVVVPNTAKTGMPEATSTPTPPIQQTPSAEPAPVNPGEDSKATNTPDMTIESLSEPAVSTKATTTPNPTRSTPSADSRTPEPAAPASSTMANTPPQTDTSTPKMPKTPVNPLENQEVGPISLDANTTTPVPAVKPVAATTATAASTEPIAAPIKDQTPPPPQEGKQPVEEKPKANEPLDSVLQNLQSQVQNGEDSTDTAPKS